MSVNTVKQDGSLQRIAGGTLYADAPIGAIMPYGGATAPFGWLLCQGQAVSRTDYSDLFNIIGTAFGTGDGSTTFNLPDLRETAPVGSGTRGSGVTTHDTYTLGEFKDDQLQNHKHDTTSTGNISQIYSTSSGNMGSGNVLTATGRWDSSASNQFTYTKSISVSGTSGDPTTGRHGTTTHGKQLGVNYIIKAKQAAMPADFIDAIDDVLNTFAKPISLQSANNSTISFDKSRVVGGLVTVCADITVQSGSYLVKENAIANVPNYGTGTIGYILPCIYRNTASGAEEPGYALVNPTGNIFPYYTKSEYNEMRINASYSSKN